MNAGLDPVFLPRSKISVSLFDQGLKDSYAPGMPVRRRYLAPQVLRDLRRKMVFVSGPRQVGKTTLARSLPGARVGYLNWEVAGETLHHAAAFPPNRCPCISARLAKSCTSRAKFGTCTTGTARGSPARNISRRSDSPRASTW